MSFPKHYGEYLLLERLGAGGMSEVDLARREVAQGAYVRFVVIKRISAKNVGKERHIRMFQDEARINAELHHENIAQVYDFGEVEDEFYLAMEYVPGMDLRQIQRVLAKRWGRRLPLREGLSILRSVLLGLQYAHTAVDTLGRPMNLVHRDVNPRNIMVSIHGDVKLIDFGVAKATHKLDETQTHGMKGKFAYMSPEQIQAKDVDARTDVFAMGLVLQEIVNGISPFAGLNEVQIIHRVMKGRFGELNADPAYPRPDLLVDIRARALDLKASGRYPDCKSFVEAIDLALEPIGGACSKANIAEFLKAVDPEGTRGIEQRLANYHAGEVPEVEPPQFQKDQAADGSLSASLDLDAATRTLLQAPAAASGSGVVPATTHSQMKTGTLVMAVGGGALAALLILVVGAAGAWWWFEGRSPPSVFEVSTAPSPRPPQRVVVEEEEPAVAEPEPEPELEPEPEPVVRKRAPKETRSRPAPVEVSLSPTPVPASIGDYDIDEQEWEEATQGGEASIFDAPPPVKLTETPPGTDVTAAPPKAIVRVPWFINSRPSGLEVFVDGKFAGVTPKKLDLTEGEHEFLVRSTDGRTAKETVTVSKNARPPSTSLILKR
ncbi:MAG: serine/threonine-protein kinase [Myxococcota bacterium]|nr:serine/threonine-protein kinase [Myxococcota bacterium]